VLETFTPTRTSQTASEIGRRAQLPSSTAHRIVGELISSGLLERDQGRQVRIGLRLWELTTRSSRALRLRQVALPFMERVQAKVLERVRTSPGSPVACRCTPPLRAWCCSPMPTVTCSPGCSPSRFAG
jgi:DNA-binding IclR family transcriptional regulator